MVFGEKTVEQINGNIMRIRKKKNRTDLFELNMPEKGTDDGTVLETGVDGNGNFFVKRNGEIVFSEYSGDDTVILEKEKDFTAALKEGHTHAAGRTRFKTQINIKLFDKNDKVYGLGDKAAPLNRRDHEYVSWNSDDPTQHNETYRSLYKSINFFIVNHSKDKWYGVFYPSSHKCVFNLGFYSDRFIYIGSEKGEYDYFLLLGDSPAEVIKAYYSLVGRSVFTTMKFLGNHQSRWSYTNEEAHELVRRHTEEMLPLDYIHFDIDYMNGYRVYTVNDEYVPDFSETCREFLKQGVGVITIIDPAVKKDPGYGIYDDLTKMRGFATLDGQDYVNEVWPGDACYPNYMRSDVRNYLSKKTAEFMEKYNISGIWGDMNEPASFRGPLPDEVEFTDDDGNTLYHDEIHNLYAEYMSKTLADAFTKNNRRPTLITRAGFATTMRYTTSWNGDNQSLWDHLRTSLPQVMTMNMSGFFMNGVDVGGFGNDTNRELLIRWVEADIFMPYFRNHSCINSRYQEPYAFDDEIYEIYKKFLNIRYEFIPYLYTLQWEAYVNGTPMFAPLFYYFPEDEAVKEINDEVMIGPYILHAPIVDQGKKQRVVYLPEGRWVDYLTGETYEGGENHIVNEPLDHTAIFIKEGALIPQLKGDVSIEPEKIRELVVYKAVGKNYNVDEFIPFELHWDDGVSLDHEKGVYDTYRITAEKGKIKAVKVYDGFGSDLKIM